MRTIFNIFALISYNLCFVATNSNPFTGLILISGSDTPGITQALFDTLAPFSATVVDIEQVVIRGRLILTVLISLDPAHAKAIEDDLVLCGERLSVDIAVSFSEQDRLTLAVKTGLIHVVALAPSLHPRAIASIATEIKNLGGNIEKIARTASYPVTAIEFVISGAEIAETRKALSILSSVQGVDISVSPGGLMRWAKKLVVMDVDSTLIQQEVIELLGAKAGALAQIKEITNRAMAGEMDFEASLRERVLLLKGLPESVLSEVGSEISLTPGATTLITTLQKLGHNVAAVSGGFSNVIAPLLSELKILDFKANTLEVKEGLLTGEISGSIIDRAAKATALAEFAKSHNIALEQTIAIGDGANDLDMIAIAGLGIAFNAKPAVKAAADSTVSAPYLDSVLYLLGISRDEIEEAGTSTRKN